MTRHLIALGLGLVGFGFAWGGWHLWLDHQNLHALIHLVQQAQQQKK